MTAEFYDTDRSPRTAWRLAVLMGRNTRTYKFALAAALQRIATSEQAAGLRTELEARWSIVESSFAAGIGRSLVSDGFAVGLERLMLTDRWRECAAA